MSDEIKICASCWEEDCVCDYERYIYLDENIADIIINMNIKGYGTKYSCEGHIEPDDGSGKSYIMDLYFLSVNRIEELPEGFSYLTRSKDRRDVHHAICYKYIDGQLYARINKKYIPYDLEADKKKHLEILKNWVEALPTKDIKTHPECYSNYMAYGKVNEPMYKMRNIPWQTFCVELKKTEFELAEEYILGCQGKIEEIEETQDTIKIYYLARRDIFVDNKFSHNGWSGYKNNS